MLIHNALITGSLLVNGTGYNTGSFSGSFIGAVAGTTATASYVEYNNVANKPALVSSSAQIAGYNLFATTGSNSFNGSQTITGSLTVTGQVVAQTLNVQQVTSSIVYSSGSNIFGNSLANTQQFTGSVGMTGSLTVAGAGSVSSTLTTGADVNLESNESYLNLFSTYSVGLNSRARIRAVGAGGGSGYGGDFRVSTRATNNTWNTDVLTINSSGNVGIGTNNPSTLLHLSGSSASIGRIVSTFALSSGYSDVVQILNPNQTGGGLSFNIGKAESARNLGKIVYAHSSDGSTSNRLAFGFYDADNLLNLTAGGRVGIGTTSPGTLLHVSGYEATNWISTQTNTGTNGHVMYFGYNNGTNTTYGLYITGGGGGVEQLDFAVENKFYVNGDGKVGVGTSSPTALLDVQGPSGASGSTLFTIQKAGGFGSTEFFQYYNSSSDYGINIGVGVSNATNGRAGIIIRSDTSGNGTLVFNTTATERMRIHANGAVTVKSGSQPTGNGLHFYFNSDISKIESLEANIAWRALEIRSSQTTFDTGGNERMRITSGGSVGIGITSPSARLQVRGANELSTFFDAQNEGAAGATFARVGNSFPFNHFNFANGTVYIGTTSNPLENATPLLGIVAGASTDVINIRHNQDGNNTLNIWQTGNTTHGAVVFYKGNTQDLKGSISVSTSGVAYGTTSDYRLKTNVTPIENGLDRLMAIKPSKFNWIDTGKEAEGFIAHELQEIFPDAVTGEKDAVYSSTGNIKPQSVDYGRITPLLVKAIQELKAELDAAKAEIQLLKQQ